MDERWCEYLSSPIVQLVGCEQAVLAATQSGILYCFSSNSGRRLMPSCLMDGGVHYLSIIQQQQPEPERKQIFCAACTGRGGVWLWRLSQQLEIECLMENVSIHAILATPEKPLSEANPTVSNITVISSLSDSGGGAIKWLPVVTLSNGNV
jgi:hypothetical protein